ncbi:EAL domain-containing protein [Neptuniibacter caesariensis]|uniref:Diguanylate cyclase/phosphodiesterase (GGDEF & EAL domains) withPAS/PAC sensor n=1 Tax=Neptuniibacter caesariensis TaxID=207954 RepID=A0A7U8C6Y2_NEPCE|nr:EAL domain-containing protein [Neptuniibacter caesariensis]EAR62718.1 diguanylate cyclase/phosphodiesterase (GGDEF & EAL domains) withPAS/PAC sensor [Oceanospirillum sp. MED92] [Neptuniibacter caesariensis]
MTKTANNLRLFVAAGSAVIVMVIFVIGIIQSSISAHTERHYSRVAEEMNQNVARLIESKKKSTLALTLALADNSTIKSVLLNSASEDSLVASSQHLSAELRKHTKYKNVWIQVIDRAGVSRSRSWVDKYGDPIYKVRKDIQQILKRPHVIETISVGKFTISFKSIVPIFAEHEFIGVVEVITHFNSIIKELEQSGIQSVVLADKRFEDQLTKPISNTFIDGYYVANFDVIRDDVALIKEVGVEKLINQTAPFVTKAQLISTTAIFGLSEKPVGYYLQIAPLNQIAFPETEALIRKIILSALLIISLSFLFAFVLYRNKRRIEQQQRFIQSVTDSATDLIFICQRNTISRANKAFKHSFPSLLGQPIDSFISQIHSSALFSTEHKPNGQSFLNLSLNQEQDLELTIEGTKRYFSLNTQTIPGDQKQYVLRLVDITERKQVEQTLQLSASVFTHAREGILITERDGTIVDVNDALLQITGYKKEEVIGQKPSLFSSGHHGKEFYHSLWNDITEKGYWSGELWNKRKNGDIYAQMLTISSVKDGENEGYFVALLSDITTIKEQQKKLELIANFDPLTGLPNRRHIIELLHEGMANAMKQMKTLAVFYLDLDGFKDINDTYGHEYGDQLLVTLANRMSKAMGQQDIVGRVGGDEFIGAFFEEPNSVFTDKLHHILEQLAKPIFVEGYKLQVSASIGVTLYPQQRSTDADKLVREADQAMYQAKLAGKNRYHFFDAEKDQYIRGQHQALEDIRRALERGEFVLHYQPKVNMFTGQICGAEALIRWQHPEEGLIMPGDFIPTISAHPLSVDLDEWVILTALKQIELWLHSGFDIPVSVNISPLQLQDSEFSKRLEKLLHTVSPAARTRLSIEVIESHALENMSTALNAIEESKALGISFSLDDFGTGYSSMSYLKRLPVEELKVDRSFVHGMLNNQEDLAILSATIGLAKAFDKKILVEGVESEEQGQRLLSLGYQEAQGYFISKPISADQFIEWQANWKAPLSWTYDRDEPALMI